MALAQQAAAEVDGQATPEPGIAGFEQARPTADLAHPSSS